MASNDGRRAPGGRGTALRGDLRRRQLSHVGHRRATLSLKLRGFERAQPRQVWRRFLKSPAHVRVTPTEVVVELPRRAHNPILIASGLLDESTAVPWWNGRQLRFEIP